MKKLPMIATDMEVQTSQQKNPAHPSRDALIRDAIITTLGRPPGLYRVAVLPLWQGHYRVNVLIGPDPTSVSIPHSYFVVARDDGTIISSSPPIVRLHP
jgi:hypothetical protein